MNLFSNTEVEIKEPIVIINEPLFESEDKIYIDSQEINPGDQVYHEYGDNDKAYGICIEIDKELLVVDYTTEMSNEPKIDKFIQGIWRKDN